MHHSIHLLHADDDPEDRWLFREGIMEVDSRISLVQFEDGRELLDYLLRDPSDAPVVHLIVCDMQMAKMGGIGFLEAIKQLEAWRDTPVIIFTTSSLERDRGLCLATGAAAFFSKPDTYSENLSIIRQILTHSSQMNTAPLV